MILICFKKISKKDSLSNIKLRNNLYLLFLFSVICVFIWFIRFPVFRYGSSYIIVLLVIILTIGVIKFRILEIKSINFKKFLNTFIIIFFVLFSLKHTVRIYKNYNNLSTNNPWPQFPKTENTKYVSKQKFINKKFAYYQLREGMDGCGYTSSPCTPYPVKNNTKKINGYKFYLIKK